MIKGAENAWRVRSLQIHSAEGYRFEDYYFDSDGNITEIRFSDKIFSALYRNGRPIYWQYRNGYQAQLHWDTQGFLTGINPVDRDQVSGVECRYDYERDVKGNWVKRQETAFVIQSDFLIPRPSYSMGAWNRRLEFSETDTDNYPSVKR